VTGKRYLDLDLHFSGSETPGYKVDVVWRDRRDKVTVDVRLLPRPSEIDALLARLCATATGKGVLADASQREVSPTRHAVIAGRASLPPDDPDASRRLGRWLFEAVFYDETLVLLRAARDGADDDDACLRIRLHLATTPELAALPWEYLFDATRNEFYCLFRQTALVRYLDLPGQGWRPLNITPPLRLLALIPSPADSPELGVAELDADKEWANIRGALRDLELSGQVVLRRLETATLEALRRQLELEPFHVLHYIGHGSIDGVLLVDPTGTGAWVSGDTLSTRLRDFDSLRLVMLNSCMGAYASEIDSFAGTAERLVQGGTPAVIAMRRPITDPAAIACSTEFYRSIAGGFSVDAAIADARQKIREEETGDGLEWGTPSLYLRADDGHLWDFKPLSEQARRQNRMEALRAEAMEAERRRALTEARERWSVLAEFAPDDEPGRQAAKRVEELGEGESAYQEGIEHFQAGRWLDAYTSLSRSAIRMGAKYGSVLQGPVLPMVQEMLDKLREASEERTPDGLGDHIAEVVDKLARRQVVIFLGSDVNRAGRPGLTEWTTGQHLPSAAELASYLVERFGYPGQAKRDLVRVAQWLDLVGPGGWRNTAVRHHFAEATYRWTTLHHMLADSLPDLLRANRDHEPQVIVTASFDNALEYALEREFVPFDVVSYSPAGPETEATFVHHPYEEPPHRITLPTEEVDLPAARTTPILLVKIHGALARQSESSDSYVITEDDYLDYSRNIGQLLPLGLQLLLKKKHFLFLGYTLQDWHLRVFLNALKVDDVWRPDDRYREAAWAVSDEHTEVDREFWRKWGIESRTERLDDYVAALRRAVEKRL
jgi:hypothetical protein